MVPEPSVPIRYASTSREESEPHTSSSIHTEDDRESAPNITTPAEDLTSGSTGYGKGKSPRETASGSKVSGKGKRATASTSASREWRARMTASGGTGSGKGRPAQKPTAALDTNSQRGKPKTTYKCTAGCDRQFSTIQSKLEHESHHNVVRCEWVDAGVVCGKIFTTPRDHRTHLKLHERMNPSL
ncbi:hypothetical protein SARC_07011 [Sphaeroforma arctica JP610]|uniref:C2H2-type domain-containing protein n=1 Tax=Sphaeroforma arctica JP610 TaxID=667725 RepID=A0A0L0FVI0_9EUKA|nr:hypothetical protein SARC_07011 [Sphaeroforma arctica JP610]KNC80634.1 hypothetical protein SARC_07011 [Sphaeroforma arctica JP610]|eukprot:XP_014154536.1 hypothetical protein SARC_07011 [Sphaeroforma arctica JP610]